MTRIVVCVKPVPQALRLDAETGLVDRRGPFALTSVDESALEVALQLADKAEGGKVTALALAPELAADALRPALAIGAQRAILVSGREFRGSDLLGTGRALSAAITMLGADLVVFGAWSSDGNGAMTWAAVAELLALPLISRAITADLDAHGVLTATRQLEQGLDVVAARLPAVLAISGEVVAPRYPSFRDVVAAKKKSVEIVGVKDLSNLAADEVGIAGARTTVIAVTPAPTRSRGEVVTDEGEAHIRLAEFLRQRRLIG